MIEEGIPGGKTFMKHKIFIVFMGLALLFTACSPAGQGTATAEPIPTVIADSTIVAEGRVEPVDYAEITVTGSGPVSEVLVQEGQTVKKGELLIRLGGESDASYAAAQYEVVSAQKALNDLMKDSEADLAQAIIDLKQAKEDYEKAEVYLHYPSPKRSCITSKERKDTTSGSERTTTRVLRPRAGSLRLRITWHSKRPRWKNFRIP
jgi:multidrug efflux pump subunit AcrA (membrane-fusion protein)